MIKEVFKGTFIILLGIVFITALATCPTLAGDRPTIQELTGGGAKYCFEAIGDPGAIIQAVWALALGGQLTQIGLTPETDMTGLPLAFFPPHCKSVVGTLYGNIRTHEDIPAMADMAMRGELELGKLVTKFFRIEEINDVYEAMDKRQIVGRWVCDWT